MRLAGIAIFAAIAGLCAAAALSESFEYIVVPAKPGNPRNSEADMLRLRDGRLMLAWIDFQGEAGSDWATANISAMYSKDQGLTWGDKFTLQENIGQMNVMEPDLLRLKSGKVLFLFCRKNSEADCAPMVRLSSDDAKTFSPPKPMPITPSPSYTGFNHDRAIQLKSGRILMPLYYTPDYRIQKHLLTRVYLLGRRRRRLEAEQHDHRHPRKQSRSAGTGSHRAERWPCAHVDSKQQGQDLFRILERSRRKLVDTGAYGRAGTAGAAIHQEASQNRGPAAGVEQFAGQAFSPDHRGFERRRKDLDSCARSGYNARPHVRVYQHRVPERPSTFHLLRRTSAGKQGGQWSLKLKAVPLDWFYQ